MGGHSGGFHLNSVDVIIVGGGPVGLGLAMELGCRGIDCQVVERHHEPQMIPKGQNLTQRTMEHFAFWGVEDEIRAAREMPPGYPNSGVTAYRDLMGDYWYPWWRRSMVADYYSRSNERVPQYETERVLRRAVEATESVDIRYGWSAETVDANVVGVVQTGTGEERTLEAEFIVGCDGSHSTVREAVGMRQSLSDHDRRMVLLVFRSPRLHEILRRFGEASFFNIMDPSLEGYWRFLGRVDGEGEFFFHSPVPNSADLASYDFTRLLWDSVGASFELDFAYKGFWDLRFAVADPYRSEDVFVAGDAAHSHPPYGGYGINTGLEDVRNLGWKLAAKLKGWGDEALLDSYGLERQPVFRSTASDFIEKMIDSGRVFLSEHDPDVDLADFEAAWEQRKDAAGMGVSDFEPHYEGSPIVFGPEHGTSSAVGSHTFTARPAHHLPPSGDLFDRLGRDFTLLADPALDTAAFSTAADDLRIPLRIVEGDLAGYGSRFVLVRPDHYVSWVGEEADWTIAHRVLARSIGRMI